MIRKHIQDKEICVWLHHRQLPRPMYLAKAVSFKIQ